MATEFDVSGELEIANKQLAIGTGGVVMPLDITVRSIALAIAQKHCGDTVVSEGNLYQQLKMDGKLMGPLTAEHVIQTALVFEMYMWGKYSQDIAGQAMEATLKEMDDAIDRHKAAKADEADKPEGD